MTARARSVLSTLLGIGFLAAVFVAFFAGVSRAASLADGGDSGGLGSLIDLGRPVLDALMSGKPGLAAALTLVLLAGVAQRYAGKHVAFFNGSLGRALIVLVGAFGGAAASALVGGATWSASLLWHALGIATSAAGGYSLIKALLVEPFLLKYLDKAPSWLQPILRLALSLFAPPDPVAKAVAAGKAAVEAKPSKGAAGVTGAAQEID